MAAPGSGGFEAVVSPEQLGFALALVAELERRGVTAAVAGVTAANMHAIAAGETPPEPGFRNLQLQVVRGLVDPKHPTQITAALAEVGRNLSGLPAHASCGFSGPKTEPEVPLGAIEASGLTHAQLNFPDGRVVMIVPAADDIYYFTPNGVGPLLPGFPGLPVVDRDTAKRSLLVHQELRKTDSTVEKRPTGASPRVSSADGLAAGAQDLGRPSRIFPKPRGRGRRP